MGLMAMAFLVDTLVTAFCVWFATKLAFLDARLSTLFAIVVIVALITLIPYAGWIVGLAVFVYLLMSVTGASLVQCMLVVVLTRLVAFGAVFLLSRIQTA